MGNLENQVKATFDNFFPYISNASYIFDSYITPRRHKIYVSSIIIYKEVILVRS